MLLLEELNKKYHDRKKFDCGLADVNDFLQKKANKQAQQSVNRTWVAIDHETMRDQPAPIAGFFTLTSCTIAHQDIAGQYPHYPLPAFKLAWIGVDDAYQGTPMRVGEELLLEALYQTWQLFTVTKLGVAILVDPLTQDSENFFRKYDFVGIGRKFHGQETLYLPIEKIRRLIEQNLIVAAVEKFGSQQAADRWFVTQNSIFGGTDPKQLMTEPGGVKELEQFLYGS